jgi:hypothetical protein
MDDGQITQKRAQFAPRTIVIALGYASEGNC